MYSKRTQHTVLTTRGSPPLSSNVNSNNTDYIEYQDGSVAVMNHNETVEEINHRIKEEKRRKEEERLKKLRIETAKRRKRQEQLDAELKEQKENEIEKALQDRKKQIEASNLRTKNKTPDCTSTTTTTTANNSNNYNNNNSSHSNNNNVRKKRPISAGSGKLPSIIQTKENREETSPVADIVATKKQIRHLNVLESLDLQGISSSTDIFLLAEKMSKRSSVRESEAVNCMKMIQVNSARSPTPKDVPLESPSNKTKRVRIQIVEPEERRKISPRNENNLKLPQIGGAKHPTTHTTITTTTTPEKKVPVEKKKKPVLPLHTGVSIDIDKIEKDIALIDKALLEKYQSLRTIDNNALKRVNTSDRSTPSPSPPPRTATSSNKKKPKRAKPVLSLRQRKF